MRAVIFSIDGRRIDADAFAIVIRTLLENALVHSPAGSRVEVRIDPAGRIVIRNHGAIIDAAFLGEMTGRFMRGATGAEGSGLGLSIVERLVRQMHGTLAFQSPAAEWPDGLAVTLTV